ncbi:hypothetical protein THAOC_26707 [Thalassiosira oceanica]|uniref:Uncharacterized protein n=1 Tax=Thalassiosira oceanica TaxID=159749 RepID=K0RKR9_THAOC|nr:hypothetical protein THAOC_26707 [Thalassiosira oceanica]|eukprot:EJK53780.1 hypothetical protein THAOC_26707 [Thalassiosira oceanica]
MTRRDRRLELFDARHHNPGMKPGYPKEECEWPRAPRPERLGFSDLLHPEDSPSPLSFHFRAPYSVLLRAKSLIGFNSNAGYEMRACQAGRCKLREIEVVPDRVFWSKPPVFLQSDLGRSSNFIELIDQTVGPDTDIIYLKHLILGDAVH